MSFFFSNFSKVDSFWKWLTSANLYLWRKHFFNLFETSIRSPKIYSFMGLTWMCLEVLTEIYDVVQIIWRTSKLWFFNFLDIFLGFGKIFSQFFFYFVGRQTLGYVFGENKAIWKSFQQLTLIESLFFSDFWKIHFLWKLLILTNLVFYKENFFKLFQNWISFLKIYSCMGVIWMYLEVLTEIYD